MNKQIILTLLISLSVCHFALAQEIPNNGFENWATTSAKNPTGWSSLNWTATMFGAPFTCTKTTDTVAGQYAMKLQTTLYGADTVDGFAFTGSWPNPFDSPLFGYAYTKRPATLTGHYKFSSPAGDSCVIIVFFTKWNNTLKKQDSIGSGVFYGKIKTAYTPFEIPITYSGAGLPDTATVVLLGSSQTTPTKRGIPGNTLLVDELAYTFSSGVREPLFSVEPFKVYPNPFSGMFRIELQDRSCHTRVTIVDAFGKEILSRLYQGENPLIDLSGYSKGIYLLGIHTNDKSEWVRLVKE